MKQETLRSGTFAKRSVCVKEWGSVAGLNTARQQTALWTPGTLQNTSRVLPTPFFLILFLIQRPAVHPSVVHAAWLENRVTSTTSWVTDQTDRKLGTWRKKRSMKRR